MPGFVASCFNPATDKTTTSDVDTLPEAKIRARTLRGVIEPFEQQAGCITKVREPDGTTWVLDATKTPPVWERDEGTHGRADRVLAKKPAVKKKAKRKAKPKRKTMKKKG